ncbi:MAG: hypothetical protein ACM3MF_01535 [Anaerolineae bacterium]
MKVLRAVLLLVTITISACAPLPPATSPVNPGWHVHSNSRYGYEIRYPDRYDAWETGPEGERDGATFRVGLKEYQAPVPVLDVRVHPRMPAEQFPAIGMRINGMDAELRSVLVNGMAAREVQYRWAATHDLARVEVYVRGVVFEFMPSAGTTDFHQTEWWAIISTFRFIN